MWCGFLFQNDLEAIPDVDYRSTLNEFVRQNLRSTIRLIMDARGMYLPKQPHSRKNPEQTGA